MLNVNDLEKRWRKYKIKFYLPHIIIFISLSVIFILISTIKNYKPFNDNSLDEETKVIVVAKKKEHKIEKQSNKTVVYSEQNITKVTISKTKKQPEIKKILLSPSLNFMSNIKHSYISRYENDEVHVQNTYNKPKKKNIQKQIVQKQKPIEVIEVIEIEKEEKKHIQISRQNTQEDISHVIKRFKKNNNPALSLFVAKKYYELEEYHKSYNYALITNEINDNIDASWIIFTKSLVKLNEKDEAIKTLKKYIEHSHSSQAKILLEEIKSGKFK
jgi:tetratricopeptide (TPR) repeat protein